MCVNVKQRMRTAAAVAWEAAAKKSLLVLVLSLLDRGCCSSVYCSGTGCRSSTCCCCGCCSSTRRWWSTRSHPAESLVEQSSVSSGYWLCVSWAESSCPTESRREKKQRKNNDQRKKSTSAYAYAPFSTGQHMGRPMGGPVKSTGRPT